MKTRCLILARGLHAPLSFEKIILCGAPSESMSVDAPTSPSQRAEEILYARACRKKGILWIFRKDHGHCPLSHEFNWERMSVAFAIDKGGSYFSDGTHIHIQIGPFDLKPINQEYIDPWVRILPRDLIDLTLDGQNGIIEPDDQPIAGVGGVNVSQLLLIHDGSPSR
jgi:hypothetical protein